MDSGFCIEKDPMEAELQTVVTTEEMLHDRQLALAERKVVDQKFFPCPEPGCTKTFTKSSNLNQHLRIHSGENPFCCKLCGRTFRQSGNLNKHLKSHEIAHLRWNRLTKDKPFKCQKCEKSFTANSSLQNHVKLHCGNVKVAGATIEADSSIVASTGVKYPEAKASASGDRVEDTSSGCQFQQLRFHCMHASCGISFKTEDDLRSHLHESNPSFEADYSFLRTSMSQLVGLLGQLVESGDSARNLSSKLESINFDEMRQKLLKCPMTLAGTIDSQVQRLNVDACDTPGAMHAMLTTAPTKIVEAATAMKIAAFSSGCANFPSEITQAGNPFNQLEAVVVAKNSGQDNPKQSKKLNAGNTKKQPRNQSKKQIWDFAPENQLKNKVEDADNALSFLAYIAQQSAEDMASLAKRQKISAGAVMTEA